MLRHMAAVTAFSFDGRSSVIVAIASLQSNRMSGLVDISVAFADGGRQGVEFGQVIGCENHLSSASVLGEVSGCLGTGNGDHPFTLCDNPGQCDLSGCSADPVCDGFDPPSKVEVCLNGGLLEPR